MKPERTYPDPQRLVVDYLDQRMTTLGRTVTTGIGVPRTWRPENPPHLQISCDGTPVLRHPVSVTATVRVVAWSDSQTLSNELAALAQAVLLAVTSQGGMAGVQPLTGPQPAKDADTGAELCYVTVGVRLRSIAVV